MAKILFLEDEKMIREVLAEYMTVTGYEVSECERLYLRHFERSRQRDHFLSLQKCVFSILHLISTGLRSGPRMVVRKFL